MRTFTSIIGIVMILVGGLWSLQGLGYVGGSFMSGDPKWLYIGLAVLVVGLGLLVRVTRRGSRTTDIR